MSIIRHLWYLTEELVVFAFFDEGVQVDVKTRMAANLLNTRRPRHFLPGKPIFPEMIIQTPNATLDQFIGRNSWLLFDKLGCNGAWLALRPDQWQHDAEYNHMSDIAKKLAVVNDSAERVIKDVQEYANSAKDSVYREAMILVSNDHKLKIPECNGA